MGTNRTSISDASSYREIGEFWDSHDLAEHWDETRDVPMDVEIQSSTVYFPVDRTVAEKLRSLAETQGVSPEALLNTWLEEHVGSDSRPK